MDVKRIHETGDIVVRTKQHHFVTNPMAIQQSDKLGIFNGDSGPARIHLKGNSATADSLAKAVTRFP
ncbi:hypothetical protein ACVDG5_003195 [Mesorhizobium sp. ORM6]